MRYASTGAITLAWLAVSALMLAGGELGVGSATLMLLAWVGSTYVGRFLGRLLAVASILVLVIVVVTHTRTDLEALVAIGLLTGAATLMWCDVTPVAEKGRLRTSLRPASTTVREAESVSTSDEEMETQLIESVGLEDDPLESGICGPEWVSHDGADILSRARKSGAFKESELNAIRSAITFTHTPVRALRRMIGNGEISKFQAMHLLWGQESQLRFGDYVLIEIIGRGASSVVYRARHVRSGDSIALKIMHADEQSIRRVHREMKSVLKLAHPNIVVAYDSGKIHSRYFIAMELIGSDLNRLVHDQGPLDQHTALVSVLQIALALEQAHERGILHRDVKPGNMLLTASGDVKLADLGLSCPLQRMDESGSFETAHNALGGTLAFMAPEQVRDFRDVDARADTFGLGSSLFFLLTGKSRLPGRNLAERINNLTVHKHFLETADYIDSPPVAALIDQLCTFSAEERIASATEAVGAIRRTITQLGQPDHESLIRVLMIENESDNLYGTLSDLAAANHTLETKRSTSLEDAIGEFVGGVVADDLSAKTHFDIIFLNDGSYKKDLRATLQRIRKVAGEAALIMVGDHDDARHRSDCVGAGADSFISRVNLTAEKLEREIFVAHARRRVANQSRPTNEVKVRSSGRIPSVAF